MVDYLCALFVGDDVKLRLMIRQHERLETDMEDSRGNVLARKLT